MSVRGGEGGVNWFLTDEDYSRVLSELLVVRLVGMVLPWWMRHGVWLVCVRRVVMMRLLVVVGGWRGGPGGTGGHYSTHGGRGGFSHFGI